METIAVMAIFWLSVVVGYLLGNPKKPSHEITNHHVEVLKELQEIIYRSNVKAGWYTDLKTGKRKKRNYGELIALIHSEASESLEGWRKGLMDDHLPHRTMKEVELADLIIRTFDAAASEGMDLAGALQEKFAYNQTRSDHKIENRVKDGGKKA